MKSFVVALTVLIGLVGLHFCNSSVIERRFREGNNGLPRSKGCTMLCSLKINFNKKNNQGQQTCYQLPGQNNQNNITISECVYNCMKMKGVKLDNATQCICQNGECIAPVVTSSTPSAIDILSSTTSPTTSTSSSSSTTFSSSTTSSPTSPSSTSTASTTTTTTPSP